jgi:hypothetical protein
MGKIPIALVFLEEKAADILRSLCAATASHWHTFDECHHGPVQLKAFSRNLPSGDGQRVKGMALGWFV